MKKQILWLAIVLLAIVACKKDIPGVFRPDQYAPTDFNQIFEAFWTGMNNNYVFWSIDTVNWDKMYAKYKPQFAALNHGTKDDTLNAYHYLQQMTQNLIDGHYNISFLNKGSILSSLSINPASARKKGQPPFLPFLYFVQVSGKHYMDRFDTAFRNDTVAVGSKNPQVRGLGVMTGVIQQHILYFRLNQFLLADMVAKDTGIRRVWIKFMEDLHNPTLATKGLIIDVRSNPGGLLEDMNFLVGRLVTKPLSFAYTREKSGNGRLDYTPWADAVCLPSIGAVNYTAPIVVLTDKNSISMSEMTAMALKRLPNTHIIGDTTWGANGPLSSANQLYLGGQFYFANFGFVYTSSAMYKYRDGKVYEGKGFPPDQYVPFNSDSVSAGKDTQLEAAIQYLNK